MPHTLAQISEASASLLAATACTNRLEAFLGNMDILGMPDLTVRFGSRGIPRGSAPASYSHCWPGSARACASAGVKVIIQTLLHS